MEDPRCRPSRIRGPIPRRTNWIVEFLILSLVSGLLDAGETLSLRGQVVDATSGEALPARVYLRGSDGTWHFPRSADAAGSAVPYRKERFGRCVEMHTTLSAHPFVVSLPPGKYTITVERGKEYFPLSRDVELTDTPVAVELALRRWIDMGGRGWFSGDTHVHRTLEELPNLLLAEDLNVAFPLLNWVTEAFQAPATSSKSSRGAIRPEVLKVDATHVIYPMNTEYEIFRVGRERHTLGAIFILNHRRPFDVGVPPVQGIARRARSEGALLELDKHNWPWSMMLIPVMEVDLFELSNNHVWRTEFGFASFGEREAAYMDTERDARGFTERGWIDFGMQNYYALLNCGYRLRVTAGTASGVHPVPLGFGRVYVHLGGEFSYSAWVKGLDAGRSFVTTGPMLFVTVDGRLPGETFRQDADERRSYRVRIEVVSEQPLERTELVVNGEVHRAWGETAAAGPAPHSSIHETSLEPQSSSWLAVRCFERRGRGRIRFAHTGPFFIDVAGRPLRPRRAEVNYLIRRVEEQIARSSKVLPAPALEEYREALRIYRMIARTAR